MAHLSSDAGLLHAFAHELDVHSATAAEVFDVALEAVNNDQRRKAKAINFGLIYGMSAFGLAKQIGVSRSEAQQYIDRYFARYPGVADYMDATRALAHEQGYVETLLGRRLYLPEINARNKQRQLAAERTAINAPMQGTAADIIKLAMIEVDRWLTDSALDAKMIMQVHDELVFELPTKRATRCALKSQRAWQMSSNSRCRYLPRWVWALTGMRLTDPRALLVLSIFNWRDISSGSVSHQLSVR
jgi:DNA polymerase-1